MEIRFVFFKKTKQKLQSVLLLAEFVFFVCCTCKKKPKKKTALFVIMLPLGVSVNLSPVESSHLVVKLRHYEIKLCRFLTFWLGGGRGVVTISVRLVLNCQGGLSV